jgi:hypothetical protein
MTNVAITSRLAVEAGRRRLLDREGKWNARSKTMLLTLISRLAITAVGGTFV